MFQPALAQLKFSAQASTKEMNKGDYVQVQFVLENAKQIDQLQPPDLGDFTILQGPNESTGMSIENGVVTQYKGISFLLQPKRAGNLMIKPAVASADGQSLRSNTLQIVVHNVNGSGNNPPAGFSPLPDPSWPSAEPAVEMDELLKPGDNVAEKISRNFFIKVEVSKTDCYLGEPIVATYKLYARLRSDSRVTKHPSLNGFSVYDMMDPSEDRVSVEKLNGRNYSVHIIRKAQLIPLQPGDVTLDPVELDNNIFFIKADGTASKNQGQGLGGLLDRLFEPDMKGTPFTQHIVLQSKPVTVHVKPLPEAGQPVGFNGAVGKYSLSASVNPKEVDTGDAAVLSVVVRGTGNLPVINSPVVTWPAGMETYDMSSKENIMKTSSPLGGDKTFSYSFISSKAGKYTVPPISMSYFDPGSKTYKTVETDPIQVSVTQSHRKKKSPVTAIPVKTVEVDWSKILIWLAIFGLLAGSVIFIVRESKKDAKLKSEKARVEAEAEKIRNIPPVIHPLQESRQLLYAGDFTHFYASVNRAVWKSVADKLKLPASELNKLNIASGLRNMGWTDEEIIQLKNVLNECEMKLYTPEYSTADMQRVFGLAETVVDKLEA